MENKVNSKSIEAIKEVLLNYLKIHYFRGDIQLRQTL